MKKNAIIQPGHYPFDLIVSFAQTDAELLKVLRREQASSDEYKHGLYTDPTTEAMSTRFSCGLFLLRMRRRPRSAEDFGTLQHEIFHIASLCMEHVGMRLYNGISCEAYAYLIDYLTVTIYRLFKL